MTPILLNPRVHLTFAFHLIDQQPFTELITLPAETFPSFGFQDVIFSCLLPILLVASSPSFANSSVSHWPLNEATGLHLWTSSLFWVHSPSRWSHSISRFLYFLYAHDSLSYISISDLLLSFRCIPDISIWMLIGISCANWPSSWSSSPDLLVLKSPSHHSNQLMTILIFQVFRPETLKASSTPLILTLYSKFIGKSWWIFFQNISGIWPVLTSFTTTTLTQVTVMSHLGCCHSLLTALLLSLPPSSWL